jgi:hypothetical protein
MGRVVGKSIRDRVVYHATELSGPNLVSLKPIGVDQEPDPEVIKIQISRGLARRLGQLKTEGETLAQCLERFCKLGIKSVSIGR